MCGFAGIVRLDDGPVDRDRLGAMLRQLRHRGPDGFGVSADGRCGLVHARLSIIDLLDGHQPMTVEPVDASTSGSDPRGGSAAAGMQPSAGGLRVVFNGEVYNHRDLRRKLEQRGHRFRTHHSDTESLMLGYRQWGADLPKHLHGMFAFAVWDERERSLFLCRDRAGKKPLYVRWSRDRREVAFASLVATLVVGRPRGEGVEVDPEALHTFLRVGYPFERSLIAGIEELPPAHWMRIDAGGRVTCERYWRPPPISRHSTALGAADAVREVLTEAVNARLEADVPLGCFLSGGIDSSAVAAVTARVMKLRGGGRLRTYSVSMPDAAFDETPYARMVADHLGTEHTVLRAGSDDPLGDLRLLMSVAGEPTADSSLLPTYWLCRAARPHVKVALSGDGGDELFGGYDRYRALRLLNRRGLAWLSRVVPSAMASTTRPKSSLTRLARLGAAARAGEHPAQRYAAMIHLFDEAQIAELTPSLHGKDAWRAGLPDWPNEDDAVHAAMRWDQTHYLPFEVLRKVDRASMAVALEVRCPLLDTSVCDLAGHLPTSVLTPGGRAKGLLRQSVADLLPEPVLRRGKAGFALPLGAWLRGAWAEPAGDLLTGDGLSSLGLDGAAARRWFDQHRARRADHTHRLFALMQLALWAEWLKGPGVPGVWAEVR